MQGTMTPFEEAGKSEGGEVEHLRRLDSKSSYHIDISIKVI